MFRCLFLISLFTLFMYSSIWALEGAFTLFLSKFYAPDDAQNIFICFRNDMLSLNVQLTMTALI